jgi:two-component system nitrate/nitrite response regulator NarL
MVARLEVLADKRPLLSARENEVLDCILSGYRNSDTAEELSITEQSVKNHVRTIRRVIQFPKGTQFRVWLRTQ